MDNVKFKELIDRFIKWYEQDNHKKNEDYYKEFMNYKNLSNLNKKEFIDFFVNFVNEGGKLQSGGHRKIEDFKKTINEEYDNFRSFLLKPFEDDFDLEQWFASLSDYKGFGQGSATIYLNRINKNKFSVVNEKTSAFFTALQIKLPSNLFKRYTIVNETQKHWINDFHEI